MDWQLYDTGEIVTVHGETDVNDAGRMIAPLIAEMADKDGTDLTYARRNGRTIVRAVNAHDRLVTALARCTNALGSTATSPLERANALRDARRALAYAKTGSMSALWGTS
jgi:hypothetical protein